MLKGYSVNLRRSLTREMYYQGYFSVLNFLQISETLTSCLLTVYKLNKITASYTCDLCRSGFFFFSTIQVHVENQLSTNLGIRGVVVFSNVLFSGRLA